MVIDIGQNAPVFHLLLEVHTRACNTVATCPLPCASNGSFKMFKNSASELETGGHPQTNGSIRR